VNNSKRRTHRFLQVCSLHASLVLNDDVMARLCCTLKCLVRLQIQVKCILAVASNVTIDNQAGSRIMRATTVPSIRVFHLRRVEARVMALAADLIMLAEFNKGKGDGTYDD
jgi:hypothetical protein